MTKLKPYVSRLIDRPKLAVMALGLTTLMVPFQNCSKMGASGTGGSAALVNPSGPQRAASIRYMEEVPNYPAAGTIVTNYLGFIDGVDGEGFVNGWTCKQRYRTFPGYPRQDFGVGLGAVEFSVNGELLHEMNGSWWLQTSMPIVPTEEAINQVCEWRGLNWRFRIKIPDDVRRRYAGQNLKVVYAGTNGAEVDRLGSVMIPALPGPTQPVTPALMDTLRWSMAGPIAGMHCTQINEPADPHAWHDNYLCSPQDLGLRWSFAGPINGMYCTQMVEPSDPHTWGDNYLCTPQPQGLHWSFAGPIAGLKCLQIIEGSDPDTWADNYLCGLY